MREFTYRVAGEGDIEKIRALVADHFLSDEPLCKCIKYNPGPSTVNQIAALTALGFSTLAEDSDGNIAGVRLAYPRPPLKETDELNKKGIMETFLTYIKAETEPLLKQFNSENVLQGMLLSVDRKYRGQGLGYNLYVENMKLAKSCGFTSYVCECTSAFSARLCEKLGMTKFYECKYTDYKDEEGKPIFSPEEPHKACQVYIKNL